MGSGQRSSLIEQWVIPTGLYLTLLMIGFNIGLIQAIMPNIVGELDSTVGGVLNTLVLFSLVTAAFTPTSENLSLAYGRKAVMLGGLVLYGIGIFVVMTSPSIIRFGFGYALIMGLAAAPLVSTPWALMAGIYQAKQKELALSLLLIFSILGNLTGSILGGLIADRSTWQMAFAPQLLILVLIMGLLQFVYETPKAQNPSVDWIGGLLSILGGGLILQGIALSGEYGWLMAKRVFKVSGVVIPPFGLSITTVLLAIGLLFLGSFILWLRRHVDQRSNSLLRAGLLRRQVFIVGLITATLHAIAAAGIQFSLFQFLPTVPKLGSFETALAIMPYVLASLVVILLPVGLDRRIPPKYLIQAGLAIVVVGIWQLYQVTTVQATAADFLSGLIVMGIGSGLVLRHITPLTFSAARPEENAEASGIYNPFQDLGNSIGRAALGTLFFSQGSYQIVNSIVAQRNLTVSTIEKQTVVFRLQEALQTFSDEEQEAWLTQLPQAVQQLIDDAVLEAAVEGTKVALLVGLAIIVLCLMVSFFLPKQTTPL